MNSAYTRITLRLGGVEAGFRTGCSPAALGDFHELHEDVCETFPHLLSCRNRH